MVGYQLDFKNQEDKIFKNDLSNDEKIKNILNENLKLGKISSMRVFSNNNKNIFYEDDNNDNKKINNSCRINDKLDISSINNEANNMILSLNMESIMNGKIIRNLPNNDNITIKSSFKKCTQELYTKDLELKSKIDKKDVIYKEINNLEIKSDNKSRYHEHKTGYFSERSDLSNNKNLYLKFNKDQYHPNMEKAFSHKSKNISAHKKEILGTLIDDERRTISKGNEMQNNNISSGQDNTSCLINQNSVFFNNLLNESKVKIDMNNLDFKNSIADRELNLNLNLKTTNPLDNNINDNAKNNYKMNRDLIYQGDIHSISFNNLNKENVETNIKETKFFKTINLESIYCTVCYLDIPLRANHCKICYKCVATFDHHCTWVGNCIGEKNKNSYLIFLFLHLIEFFLSIYKVIKR